ncbi:MAG: DEAD/DEAH box helicase, partial [Magnetococcales bacterium]|nr:DEAD/DEAH box helicase [Magnetococcales bacterium]
MTALFQPGKLVSLRGREWIVLPSESQDLLLVRPLGGSDEEIVGVYLPLNLATDRPVDASFPEPTRDDLGDLSTARLLYDAARLAFRNGAGPFRSLAKLSFRPRSYQMVPLIMALRQPSVRLLIADDVGVGKTVEALLIVKELLERRQIKRFAVLCLPHLCEQWQEEIRAKIDLEAVIIRSNTQASLDRHIQGDTSVYDYYPFQVISIDFIKSDARRHLFIEQCPELVIVDEAHSCARPTGAAASQQQRHHLVKQIAQKAHQQLILLTATPHSGKPEEFHSLLGLLRPEFEAIDLLDSSQQQRRELARYFVQRKRGDVEKWLGDDTPFPERETFEQPYKLSTSYEKFFIGILGFVRQLIVPDATSGRPRRVHYWTALALLRGVMSSPAAGLEMLRTRQANLGNDAASEPVGDNPVGDSEFGFAEDHTPTQVVDRHRWSGHQRQQLREFAQKLEHLSNHQEDRKLASAELILADWLQGGFHPVIFCRYIATANYIGAQLVAPLTKKFAKLDLRVVTSELPDELRRQHINEMGSSPRRILIATDCLSEGINLQQHFTAVLHYDLPWNP